MIEFDNFKSQLCSQLQTTGLTFKRLLKTNEVEKVFGIPENEIRMLVKRGILSPHKRRTGNWWFFHRDDVESILPLLKSTEQERLEHGIRKLTKQIKILNWSGWTF